MPSAAPAAATANSQRKNSWPRSLLSLQIEPRTGVTIGFERRHLTVKGMVLIAVETEDKQRNDRRRNFPARLNCSLATGTMPLLSLPVLSAINCSTHDGNAESEGEHKKVTLSRFASASSPKAAPRSKPGLVIFRCRRRRTPRSCAARAPAPRRHRRRSVPPAPSRRR